MMKPQFFKQAFHNIREIMEIKWISAGSSKKSHADVSPHIFPKATSSSVQSETPLFYSLGCLVSAEKLFLLLFRKLSRQIAL